MKGESVVDQAQRDEACEELQAAIDSTRLKLGILEKEAAGTVEEEREALDVEVENLGDIIKDMEERVRFLLPPSFLLQQKKKSPKLTKKPLKSSSPTSAGPP